MNEVIPVLAALALIFGSRGEGGGAQIGRELRAGDAVPATASALLVPEAGVVQLREGTALRLGDRAGWFDLDSGALRLVASGELGVELPGWRVEVRNGEALVALESEAEVCAVRGQVTIAASGDGLGDSAPLEVSPGHCRRVRPGGPEAESDLSDERRAGFLRALEDLRPPAAELPDLSAELSEQVAAVESDWADRLEGGPQREAQSCGCSEDSGSGGGLDPGGSGSSVPQPERAEPGHVWVRIRLP